MRPLLPCAALLATVGFLAIACSDSPTDSPAELTGPQLAKGGNKGKPPSGDKPITFEFENGFGDNIRSDGGGIYETGCNVLANFNSSSNDAILNLKGRVKKKDQEACGDPRFISVAFTDRARASDGTLSPPNAGGQDGQTVQHRFMNVDKVEITEGMVSRTAIVGFFGCAIGLRFDPASAEPPFTANTVNVTNNGDGTWTVKTQPFPNDVAVCVPSTQGAEKSYYHMPFSLTVTQLP